MGKRETPNWDGAAASADALLAPNLYPTVMLQT